MGSVAIETMPSGHPQATKPWIVLVGLFGLALLLRLYCLDCHSLWYDEIASIETAQRGLDAIFTHRFGWLGNQTYLHYILVWLTTLPVDPAASSLLVRLPSALAGALIPPLIYGIGKILFGSTHGLVAAFLTAVSTVLLDYSQDVRPYAMLAFLSVLAVYCLLQAEQSGRAAWWAAFTGATIGNLLYSYFAVTLVLPALAPYLLLQLVRAWRSRQENSTLYPVVLSLLAVGLAAGVVLANLREIGGEAVDVTRVSTSNSIATVIALGLWFTKANLTGIIVAGSQLLCFLAVILLTYLAVRNGGIARRGTLLCWSIFVIPPVLLVLLQTTHLVFQRYAIFGAPFYLLLVGGGLAEVWRYATAQHAGPRKVGLWTLAVLCVLILLSFGSGAFTYSLSAGIDKISRKPDYRSVARVLSGTVTNDDLVLFIDEPAHGATVTAFYGFGLPDKPSYNVRDPRVLGHKEVGDIYWVVSLVPDKYGLRYSLALPGQGWADVHRFDGVVVLKDADTGANIAQRMDNLVGKMEVVDPTNLSVKILRACVQQAEGDIARASAGYDAVGAYTPLGGEHFRTAEGFQAIGEIERAWQEAMLSKHAEPDRQDLHQWMARMLKDEGYAEQSLVEEQIAHDLRRLR